MAESDCTKFKPCSVQNCSGNADNSVRGCRGMCRSHYDGLRRNGHTDSMQAPKGVPLDFLANLRHVKTDECIIFPFGISSSSGRGIVYHDGKSRNAHRVSLILFSGIDPENLLACHTCRTKSCVNPRHLEWGTPKKNSWEDKLRDGTLTRGEKNPSNILTIQDVRDIRVLLSKNINHSDIARSFGVSKPTISSINCRRNWDWLD